MLGYYIQFCSKFDVKKGFARGEVFSKFAMLGKQRVALQGRRCRSDLIIIITANSMKKITILLGLALLAGYVVAAPQVKLSEMKAMEVSQSQQPTQGKLQSKRADKKTASLFKAAARVTPSTSETPEDVKNDIPYTDYNDNVVGTMHDGLYKATSGYESGWFGATKFQVSGIEGKYVYDEANKEIYIYNPITRYSSYSYIKGSVDDDGNVTVECPQLLACGDDGDWAYYVMNAQITEDGYSMEPVEDDINLHYKLEADGSLSLCDGSWVGLFEWADYYYYDEELDDYIDVPGEYFYDWLYYTDTKQSMRIFNEEPLKPEKNLAVESWTIAYQSLDYYSEVITGYDVQEVEACIDGDSFWIKGIIPSEPDSWIKGDINGDEISFKTSYICLDKRGGYFEYLLAGKEVFDEYNGVYVFDFSGEATMTFDAENKTITAKDGNTLVINAGLETVYYLYMWVNPIMKPTVEAAPAAPLAPVFGYYYPRDEDYAALFIFFLSCVDVNYNPLEEDSMFYMILVDGEPYEFTVEDLGKIYSESVTDDETFMEFPLDFDSNNLYAYGDGEIDLSVPFEGYDTIGAQSFYITESGDYLYSAPLIYDINEGTVGVDQVALAHGEIVNVEFVGLDGVKVARPQKGIYVMTVTYADGTRKTNKVARR